MFLRFWQIRWYLLIKLRRSRYMWWSLIIKYRRLRRSNFLCHFLIFRWLRYFKLFWCFWFFFSLFKNILSICFLLFRRNLIWIYIFWLLKTVLLCKWRNGRHICFFVKIIFLLKFVIGLRFVVFYFLYFLWEIEINFLHLSYTTLVKLII